MTNRASLLLALFASLALSGCDKGKSDAGLGGGPGVQATAPPTVTGVGVQEDGGAAPASLGQAPVASAPDGTEFGGKVNEFGCSVLQAVGKGCAISCAEGIATCNLGPAGPSCTCESDAEAPVDPVVEAYGCICKSATGGGCDATCDSTAKCATRPICECGGGEQRGTNACASGAPAAAG